MGNAKQSILVDLEHGIEEANEVLKRLSESAGRKVAESSDALIAKAKQAISTIEAKRNSAETMLVKAKDSADAASEDIKIGLQMAWADLKEAMHSVRERF